MDVMVMDQVRDQDEPQVLPQDPRVVTSDVPVRRTAAQRRAGPPVRRGRPPVINTNGLPNAINAAFRTISNNFERVRVLEDEAGQLRSSNMELQQTLFLRGADLAEARGDLSRVTIERDTAQEELDLYKVTKEGIQDLSLEKLAVGQMATSSAHGIYIAELTRRVDHFVSNADFSHSKFVIETCPICLDTSNMPNIALVDCGHTVCHACSVKMEYPFNCPRCRCISTKMMKLYGMSQV